MKILLVLLIGFVSAQAADLGDQILGTWRYEGKHMGSRVVSISTFHKDGNRYTSKLNATFLGKVTKIDFEGVWKIEDGKHVVVKVTKSTSKVFLPAGKIIRMEAVRVDEEGMHYLHDRKPALETRVDPDKSTKAK